MIGFFLLLLLVLIPLQSFAESDASQETKQTTICKLLFAHKPIDNVFYKSGIDVNGNKVTPADLNPAPIKVPEVISIPLQIDFANRLNSLANLGLRTEGSLGLVEIHKDGSVIYDGKDISAQSATLCGVSHKVEVIEEENKESDNRQVKDNPIQSVTVKNTEENVE